MSTPRVAVLGGTGHLGSRTLRALTAAGITARAASRRGEVAVDTTRPETWSALDPFDLVVDLSDTVTHPPDALVAWCLARGKTVLEATSDAPCVERLHRAHRDGAAGRLVLGAGIFTGVSNLLARDVASRVSPVDALTLGVSTSPFSGAGAGTVALMVGALKTPWVRYRDGARVSGEAVILGAPLRFDRVVRPTVYGSLAEPYMLRESTGAANVDVRMALRPGLLARVFAHTPGFIARSAVYHAVLRGYFTLLRRVLLRDTPTAVELVAEARGGGATARRWVTAPDGMDAAAWAIAAAVEALGAAPTWTGARFLDDVCALEPVCARANAARGARGPARRAAEDGVASTA
ncbi:MAG: hypothetical protein U0325_29745 [Polyangiales bacterium]